MCAPLIRLATATDADAIAQLLRVAFDAHRRNYPPKAWRSTTPEPLEVMTRLEEGPVWVACFGDRLVGTLSAIVKPDELHLRSLAVDPAARQNGVGARLLRAAYDEARARGMRSISLETAEFLAAAVSLYRRLGFEIRGIGDHHGLRTLRLTRKAATPWLSGSDRGARQLRCP
ncbi:MAG: GNAT family N-acetyltransferase [Nocardioidaceae bacterium]